MKILVTGSAGFIGYHVCKALLCLGYQVDGVDALIPYYSVKLKKNRLALLREFTNYTHKTVYLNDQELCDDLFREGDYTVVIHLAAQAGVRHSIDHPYDYLDHNLTAFLNVLEGVRHNPVAHFLYASSSSAEGRGSLYGATKLANEAMAEAYSKLFDIRATGMRFFTVYGPWGRPDMALYKFTDAIQKGEAIDLYANGAHTRAFTYVDDVVKQIVGLIPFPEASHTVKELGSPESVKLTEYVAEIEKALGKKAKVNYLPIQPGDVLHSAPKASLIKEWTPVSVGVPKFVEWFKEYHG